MAFIGQTGTGAAVSYTHLDVYKRQDLTADSAVLTVEVVDEGMHGNLYRCVVTDGQGGQTVSSVAGLWVATANALMLTEAEEKTVTFSVTAFDMDGGEKVYNEFGGKLKALIGSDYTYKDVIDIGTVSYTHLDVYKRQAQDMSSTTAVRIAVPRLDSTPAMPILPKMDVRLEKIAEPAA